MGYKLKGKKKPLQYCFEEEEEEDPLANLPENVIFDSEEIYTHNKTKEKNLLKEHPLPDFPEHVIYYIIAKIPAEYLPKLRYVCKSWNELISNNKFIAQNFFQNNTKFLIQVQKGSYFKATSLRMDEKELDFKLDNFGLARMGRIRSSCNGLLLTNDPKIKGGLNVINFLTKCKVVLPQCPSSCSHLECGVALGFIPSTKEYKVVHIYADGLRYEIFTLGCSDNKWKCIPGPFKEPYERPFQLYTFCWSDPASMRGQILHWYVSSNQYVISMDVNDEKPRKTYLPTLGKEIKRERYSMLEMGGYLSVVYNVSNIEIDIWILKDFLAQVWFKKHSILAESINYTSLKNPLLPNKYNPFLPDFHKLVPLAGLRNGEVIMFRHENSKNDGLFYLYEIKNMEFKKFKMKFKDEPKVVPHRSSLVCWKTESELLPREST